MEITRAVGKREVWGAKRRFGTCGWVRLKGPDDLWTKENKKVITKGDW